MVSVLSSAWASAQNMASQSVLFMNGTAHIGNGQVINQSAIGIKDGKLMVVANALVTKVDVRLFDTVIDIKGQHVYPGIIGTNSTLGLSEVEAVRATIDFDETGAYNPNVRSLIAYNTDSRVIPTVRSNGILLVQTTPRGGRISGSSSVMRTSGWNWEDAVAREDDGIHVNWPSYYQQSPSKPGSRSPYEMQVEELTTFLRDAQAYAQSTDPDKKDLRFTSMRGIFKGAQRLYIHAQFAKEIIDAVNLCRDLSIKLPVLVGGYDAWRLTDLLKENRVAVMYRRVHELPMREDDPIDLPYRVPALLKEAGVEFCLQNAGDQEAANLRNLPFQAGHTVAYGLTPEQALESITLAPARILGIDQQYGSLETGKSATIFISKGDALDMMTNQVTHIFVDGQAVSTDNHHEQLYRKFSEHYAQPNR